MMAGFDTELLTTERTLQQLAFATAGRLRDIRQLLVRSVELADRSPRRRIDQEVLGRAFEAGDLFERHASAEPVRREVPRHTARARR
ncbi:MAG: hypothetical protein MZW92_07665 [Comamonadaceae bacterium]|nr:hypothetical protein [Comamonadaceae bacterium]